MNAFEIDLLNISQQMYNKITFYHLELGIRRIVFS